MLEISTTDWVGYIAMALVALSFVFKEMKTIRIVNMIGAVVFIVYGYMLDVAIPIIATNSLIIIIQAYHLLTYKVPKNA